MRGTPFAFDTETTGLDPKKHQLVMLQFAQAGSTPVIVDMRRRDDLLEIGAVLAPLFSSLLCVGINVKFDYKMLKWHCGAEIGQLFDLKLAEQTIMGMGTSEAGDRGIRLRLLDIAQKYGEEVSKDERDWFIDLDQRDEWYQPFPIEQLRYAAKDVTVLFPIMEKQNQIIENYQLGRTADLEMAATPVMGDMELAGIPIDVDAWRGVVADAEAESEVLYGQIMDIFGPAILEARSIQYDLEKEVYDAYIGAKTQALEQFKDTFRYFPLEEQRKLGGWGKYKIASMQKWREEHPAPKKPEAVTALPNINSHAQMVEAFAHMGIGKTLSNGAFVPLNTTRDAVLKVYEDQFPQLSLLRQYSKLHKFTTSFGEKLLAFVDPETGEVNPEFDQYGASTGRMSCKRPNFQQIPARSNWGTRVRACVKARPGRKILTADYSSVEPRILGVIANDPVLLKLFAEGKDIYAETARMILGIDPSVDIKKEMPQVRKLFKEIMLGLSYGMSAYALSKRVEGVSVKQAERHMASFFKLYKGVKAYLDKQKQNVLLQGHTRTRLGRWRKYDIPKRPTRLPEMSNAVYEELLKDYEKDIGRVQRQAMNMPIQGGSADITKLAAVFFKRYNYTSAKLIAIVHDEFVMECPDEEVEKAAEVMSKAMFDAAKQYLKCSVVPYPDVAISDHWSKE